LQPLEKLDNQTAHDLISFFLLKILRIMPKQQIIQKAKHLGFELTIEPEVNVLEDFLQQEKKEKRLLILNHLAATGWVGDKQYALGKMNEYESIEVKNLANFEDREKHILRDFYGQMEFPYQFQFALFFTFFAPIAFRFLTLAFNILKLKI
jgi:hypothetical protein